MRNREFVSIFASDKRVSYKKLGQRMARLRPDSRRKGKKYTKTITKMRRFILMIIAAVCMMMPVYAGPSDYDLKQAKYYTQEAEYYQKKADGYRREAQYYQKKAEGYQREAAYYTRKGDADRARDYSRRAERAMDDYKTQMKYAADADDKAADYLKRAARLLEK